MTVSELFPGVFKLTFGTPEPGTPATQRYVRPPRREALAELGTAPMPFAPEAIEFRTLPRGVRLTLPMSPGEDIYGLGLQLKSLRSTGKKRTLRVNSDPAVDTGDSHAPAPLYFSSSGYGVMLDTARYATFYCGGNEPFDAAAPEELPPESRRSKVLLTEEALYAAAREHLAPMVIDLPAARGITLYVFGGPTLLAAVRRYVLFCGGGCLPPEWGLGCFYRACGSSDQAQVAALAAELRAEHLPCDVLGLEPGWHSKAYSCSFRWHPERFPEPQKLLDELKELGFRVNLWEHAFVHPSSPLYRQLSSCAGDFKVWQGLVPDFTLPEAETCFADYHREQFTSRGVSSFKLDECDNSDFIASPWSFPECAQFPSGRDGEEMHSMFGALYMQTIERACREAGIRTYGSVRNAHLFAPPQPFVLYSDLYDHRDFIRGVTSMGFAGMLWTPELRHAESREDYLRRLQAMVLAPQMLLNIWSMPHPPWRQLQRERNVQNELYPPEVQAELADRTREILELRMRFLPYLYAAFARYHFEGIPPFRAPAMDYPQEEALRGVDYAWLAGNDLLVVPFRAGMTELEFPLPPGNWYDFYTGKAHRGSVLLRPELTTLPILVRENATIPLAEPEEKVVANMRYRLTVKTFGPNPEPARLFADDGVSWAFESGQGAWGTVAPDGTLSPELQTRYCRG